MSTSKKGKQEDIITKKLLQAIIDTIDVEVFIKDTDGIYQFANSSFCKDFNVSKDEVIGKDDYFVFPPDLAAKLQENDKRIMRSKISEMVEEGVEIKGKRIAYNTNKVPLIDEDGEVYGICGIGFDITQQKKMEEALRESEERFSGFARASGYGFAIGELTGQLVFANSATLRIAEEEREADLTTKTIYQYYSEKEKKLLRT